MAKTQFRINKSDASVAELHELISTWSKEVADIDASVAEATAFRENGNEEFLAVEKDMSESKEEIDDPEARRTASDSRVCCERSSSRSMRKLLRFRASIKLRKWLNTWRDARAKRMRK